MVRESLGFESSGIFVEKNYQAEVNLHNFFNPSLGTITRIAGILFFFINIFAFLYRDLFKKKWFAYFIPHPNTIILLFLISLFSILKQVGELLEELVALYAILYTYRIYIIVKSRNQTSNCNLSTE
jgi:hypothetical protein